MDCYTRAEDAGEHANANQKPDLFLPDTNQARDVGIVQSKSVASYYKAKMQAHGARTMPIILGTNGTIHGEPENTWNT